MTPDTPRQAGAVRPKLNAEVLKLGLVSFLTDLSSEAIFSVFAPAGDSFSTLAKTFLLASASIAA